MDIKQVKQRTVAFQVIEQLKQLIAAGSLKPGDKMPNEYELAELFGVGRSTIREVLKIFQYLGIIELRNPKGTYICDSTKISSEAFIWSILLGKKDFAEISELRTAMEHQGLWSLMQLHRNDQKQREKTIQLLEDEIATMRGPVYNSPDYQIIADFNFHGHIIAVCNNELFSNIYRTVREFLISGIKNSLNVHGLSTNLPEEHEYLVEALRENNYQKAVELFRAHHVLPGAEPPAHNPTASSQS